MTDVIEIIVEPTPIIEVVVEPEPEVIEVLTTGGRGAPGPSAYEAAVELGFEGTLEEWLVSLEGSDGDDGGPGPSAYEVAVANGFVGSESAWLTSLRGSDGDDGDDGNDGASAYELAVAGGFVGDQAAWLASLQGSDGVDATAGYDLTGRTLAEVQAWLDDDDEGVYRRLIGSLTVPSGESLVIPSNRFLSCWDATILGTAGTPTPVIIGSGEIEYFTGTGSSIAGSTTLTASGLTSADVGAWIELADAGGAVAPPQPFDIPSGTLAWHGVITAVSGTSITVDTPAPLTVSGKVLKLYRPLVNTTVTGGRWVRPGGGTYRLSHTLQFLRVDGCRFSQLRVESDNAKYALFLAGASNTRVEFIDLAVSSDGVHINGPARNITITNVSGTCGDDVVPLLSASEYSGSVLGSAPWGPIENVTVDHVDAVTTGHIIKVTSWEGCKPTGLEFDHIRGEIITNPHPAIVLMGWPEGADPYFDPIGSVKISDVDVTVLDNLYAPMVYTRTAVDTLTVSRLAQAHTGEWYPVVVEGKTSLAIRDQQSDTLVYFAVSDAEHGSNGSTLLVENTHATVRTDSAIRVANNIGVDVLLNGVEVEWDDPLIPAITLGSSTGEGAKITMHAVRIPDAGYFIHVEGWTELHLYGDAEPYRAGWQPLVDVQGNATLFLHGDTGNINSMSGAPIIKGGSARVFSLSSLAKVDVSILATTSIHAPLQLAYNTNAAAAGGVGPVMFDGTSWKPLAPTVPTVDPLDLSEAAPAAPAADKVRLFGQSIAGRMLPAFRGPSGLPSVLQANIARNRVGLWAPAGGTGTSNLGFGTSTVGTATAAAMALTNAHTYLRRLEYLVTTAATTAVANFRGSAAFFAGGSAALGGYFVVIRWGPATGMSNATRRGFAGVRGSTAAATDVNPSTLANIAGMGWDSADTNIQFMHNDGSGTATKVDLGAAFPKPSADRTKAYELALFVAPGTTNVHWQVTDLETGDTAEGVATSDTPATSVLMTPSIYTSVGGTSAVTGIAVASVYYETDN